MIFNLIIIKLIKISFLFIYFNKFYLMSKRLRKVFKRRSPKKIQKIKNKKNNTKKEKKAQPSFFLQEDTSKDFNFTEDLLKDLSESQELNHPDDLSIFGPIEKNNETKKNSF